ncbi:hypothetical protein IPZ58_09565 [Streptomyces roseoverticillatus]|uniref:hypothetical protein n=1 Tax=Streptomyces roseoverticillatus TaxID=66429 RepID=UPI001F47CBCD|nr:hypothetical protein [Streptomyces roseoverticillatus]MCF3101829.1 hypothetical protein [Streptomyces roseoverticillatus]
MRIELRVGRLVLDGIHRHDAPALRTALEHELAALLTRAPDGPYRSHRVRRLGTPPVVADTDPAVFGRRVAHAVHTGLRAAPEPRTAGRPSGVPEAIPARGPSPAGGDAPGRTKGTPR